MRWLALARLGSIPQRNARIDTAVKRVKFSERDDFINSPIGSHIYENHQSRFSSVASSTRLPSPNLFQMPVAHIGALRSCLPQLAPQLRRSGSRALRQAHHDGITLVGRTAEPFANLVLVLDFDAA